VVVEVLEGIDLLGDFIDVVGQRSSPMTTIDRHSKSAAPLAFSSRSCGPPSTCHEDRSEQPSSLGKLP
jgi:hypothetical protein